MNRDITTTIRELFFRHDCVIIPGFGGFILNYVPATVDKSTSLFHPPARRVSFNRNLTHNDGLLIGAVGLEHGIGYTEAREEVEMFASELRRKLSQGEQVAFEHIGTFQTNREGNIQFEPVSAANYNLNSYGMEPVRFEPAGGYDVRQRVIKPAVSHNDRGIPVRKLLVRAAVAVPVLIALVAVPLKTDIFRSRMEKASLNPLASAELEQNRKAIDEMPVITGTDDRTTETLTSAANEESLQVTAIPDATVQPETIHSYYIIAGSFLSADNAMVMADKLRSMGYQPELMEAPNGYTRVAARGFADIDAATAEKNRLASEIAGLWVLKVKQESRPAI